MGKYFKKRRRRSDARHAGLVERDNARQVTAVPDKPLPSAYAENVFGLLNNKLQYAIADVGYAVPTPIQEKAMPSLLAGRDLIGCAQTGTGKTAAFMLPILHKLLASCAAGDEAVKTRPGHPRALVLSPTRELSAQTASNTLAYAKYTPLKLAVVFGGVGQSPQVAALRNCADIVVATPGRLIDLMTQGEAFLDAVEFFVLDEADRMLDMGFLPDVKRIISKLPQKRQSLFFSATLSPEIMRLAGELVKDPVQIAIEPEHPAVDRINQKIMFVEKRSKDALLLYLLENHPEWDKVIVFARTRRAADRIERKLRDGGVKCKTIHSDKTQNQRTQAMSAFRDGAVRVLVATDIASRGIDVPDVSLVVNTELPVESESYIHRIGRTARAGNSGCAVSFVAPDERSLLKGVERFARMKIPVDRDHPFHCDAADKKAATDANALPVAPWIKRDGKSRNDPENKHKNRDHVPEFRKERQGGAPHGGPGNGRRNVDFSAGGGKFRRRPHNGRNMKFGRSPNRPK